MFAFQLRNLRQTRLGAAALGAALLAGCAAKAPPPPPPPPPPVVVIPPRPQPPGGAVATMFIPGRDALGVRQTVNANLTPAQLTWNLRSALNVAALNCLGPQYAAILPNYTGFLKTHAKRLTATNRALDAEFRKKYGKTARHVRDTYMTQVYNYFALPPALPRFCDAALAISNEAAPLAPADLDAFAAGAVPRLEQAFETFFQDFEQYRIDVAAWDARYGPRFGVNPAGYSNPLAPGAPPVPPAPAAGPAQPGVPAVVPAPTPTPPAPVATGSPAAPTR